MRKEYTLEEMLALWRARRGIDMERTDCEIETEYGALELDAVLKGRIDRWYDRLLTEAPLAYLAVDNVADAVTEASLPRADGSVLCDVAADIVRLLAVRWQDGAEAEIAADAARASRLACNPYTARPAAAVDADGRGLVLWHAPRGKRLYQVLAVVRPRDGRYVMDTAAEALIAESGKCNEESVM